jgi:hypothetical protein
MMELYFTHYETRGTVEFGGDDSLAFLFALARHVLLQLTYLAGLGQLKDELVRFHVFGEAWKRRRDNVHIQRQLERC